MVKIFYAEWVPEQLLEEVGSDHMCDSGMQLGLGLGLGFPMLSGCQSKTLLAFLETIVGDRGNI